MHGLLVDLQQLLLCCLPLHCFVSLLHPDLEIETEDAHELEDLQQLSETCFEDSHASRVETQHFSCCLVRLSDA